MINHRRWRLLILIRMILTASVGSADYTTMSTDILLSERPIISPPDDEIILQKGQNYTLTCKGNNPLYFSQQEIPEENMGPFTMEIKEIESADFEYAVELNLYNVDQFAVGYYVCFDDTINPKDVLSNISEEPKNTVHASYIYIYVNGTDNLFAPMTELVVGRSGSKVVVIQCRPTTPDVIVNLSASNKKRLEIIKYSPKIGFLTKLKPTGYKCDGRLGDIKFEKFLRYIAEPPKPIIHGGIKYFLDGDTFTLNCTVIYQTNIAVALSWVTPDTLKKDSYIIQSNEHSAIPEGGILYSNMTVYNATENAAGNYYCTSQNVNGNFSSNFEKKHLDEAMVNLSISNNNPKSEPTAQKLANILYYLDAYPPAKVTYSKNNIPIILNKSKYEIIKQKSADDYWLFKIKSLDVQDIGNYTITASNGHKTVSETYSLLVKGHPTVSFKSTRDRYVQNTRVTLSCEVTGYPLPIVQWIFESNGMNHTIQGKDTKSSLYELVSHLVMNVTVPGNITCVASGNKRTASVTRNFLVYELKDGFGIRDSEDDWFSERESVYKSCVASKYDYSKVTWEREGYDISNNVIYRENDISHIAILNISEISVDHAGDYTCIASKPNGTTVQKTISLTVIAYRQPSIRVPTMDTDLEVSPYQPLEITCEADAVPPPKLEWSKDGYPLSNNSNVQIITQYENRTVINSTVQITFMEEDKGRYECTVSSGGNVQSKSYNLLIKENSPYKAVYLSIIGVIIFVLILLVGYLILKIRKEKQFRKELAAAGLLYFKEGVTRSLNPELGIGEQAELLPYDDRFEFPVEKLIEGKQLGAGAFGVVYKAEARGIVNAEETTTVAVKKVKDTADNAAIKALASELKIMVHLGKHAHIVNLLGACTKNVFKRELVVIVEYCKFGNIHNYLQKHREVFIDQLTDNSEKSFGKVNKAFTCSTGSTGMHSDYYGSNHTQETDNTFLNTATTNRSMRKVSDTGYVQPEWMTNYEADYSYDGRSPRPLCSRDLLAWAFQIAMGMEYLASRKVLHGDLAARNILLAEGNIVKICDFGLARSVYKNDEYQKKAQSLLPVKWVAIECMTDRIFSTQSDVWSYGIVLWELFSLAKTPYPNISAQHLVQFLSEGHRLERPPYGDDRLYKVMLHCWAQKPTMRPSFTDLRQTMGTFLEDNVRNHYEDLNEEYMQMNKMRTNDQEDYLAMVCAPDYNNMVTPSPHHYANESQSFFPITPIQLPPDEEGYLQMSPASNQTSFTKGPANAFDFDRWKCNPRTSEASSTAQELTPMLPLSSLSQRVSDSDNEGHIAAIDEENEV